MGGALTAHSAGMGEGTTFDFTIPLLRCATAEAAAAPATPTRVSIDDTARLRMLKFSNASASSLETESELRDKGCADTNGELACQLAPLGSQSSTAMMRALLAEDDRLSQALMVRHVCDFTPES